MPAPLAIVAQPPRRKNSAPLMKVAPRIAPGSELRPPITTMEKRRRLMSGLKASDLKAVWCSTYRAPAAAAMAREMAKGVSLALVVLIDMAWVPGTLSRVAISTRPVLLLRSDRAAIITSTSAPRHTKYMPRSLPKAMRSHSEGRGTKSGTNQGTKRWRRKKLEEVTAKARVVTARNGPEMRRADRPMRKAAPAATRAPAGAARKRS